MFLLMYALFLVMNHPIKNFNTNIMVMSQSATCGQELALNKTKELVKAAAAPMQSKLNCPPYEPGITSRKHAYIILNPLNPTYIVKLGFTGIIIIFLISAQKLRL